MGWPPWRSRWDTGVRHREHAVITAGIAVVVWHYRIATVDLGQWWNVVLLFVLVEFAYYWYHRESAFGAPALEYPSGPPFARGIDPFGRRPSELDAGALVQWLFYMPLVWIGFDPGWVFGMVSASLLYQFWLHTTLISRLGPLAGFPQHALGASRP